MMRLILPLTLGMALLSGCVSETVKSTSVPVLDTPTTLAPEAELLDVGVVILDPGISAEEDEELEEKQWSKEELKALEAQEKLKEIQRLQNVVSFSSSNHEVGCRLSASSNSPVSTTCISPRAHHKANSLA